MSLAPVWIDLALSAAVGLGLAAATGLRVFLPMLVLGVAGRMEWVALGPEFAWLGSDAGLATLVAATIVEVGAYYIPTLDNALDLVATPVAIAAGAVALAAVTGDLPPSIRWSLAVLAGGGTAGAVQGLTTLARLKSTGLTAGLANPFLATFELGGALTIALLAIAAPLLALGLVMLALLVLRRVRHGRPAS